MKTRLTTAAAVAALLAATASPAFPDIILRDASGAETIIGRDDALHIRADSIREATREVDFVASTDTKDSHGDIIEQATWQLDHFRSNPVILYGHDARELPIGQATYVALENGQLVVRIKFASAEANPRAEQVWKLVKEKVLRAVSVGFRPVNGAYEVRDGVEVWVWRNPILKEISVVAIGSNPDALAKTKALITAAAKDAAKKDSPAEPAERTETTTKPGAPAGEKETNTMKTVEQLTKELEDAKKDGAAKIGEINVKLVETEKRAEKAEAGVAVAEKALEESKAVVKRLEDEAKVRETEHTKACEKRDAETKRADEAEANLIELEVEALVGKKISKAEKPEFVELRKTSPTLFKSMVEKRADMALTERVADKDALGDTTPKAPDATQTQTKGATSAWNDC